MDELTGENENEPRSAPLVPTGSSPRAEAGPGPLFRHDTWFFHVSPRAIYQQKMSRHFSSSPSSLAEFAR